MDIHTATEQAYKKGYEDGKRDTETVQRALGIIEGVATVSQESVATILYNAIEMLDSVLDGGAGDGR